MRRKFIFKLCNLKLITVTAIHVCPFPSLWFSPCPLFEPEPQSQRLG
jgi:hypothetical protein